MWNHESILSSVKNLLGIVDMCEDFDAQIIMYINSVFMTLNQLGVGPSEVFQICDKTAEWLDFSENIKTISSVKIYMHLKVKLAFDPPSSSSVLESFNRQIAEFEWRLKEQSEHMPEVNQ